MRRPDEPATAGEITQRIEALGREYERTLPCDPRCQELADEISALRLKLQLIQKNPA
jgi:hypothetical protein